MKNKARNAVNLALYRKVIMKPDACESGGKYGVPCSDGKLTAHHHKGYHPEHWLDVEWLCPSCHTAAGGRGCGQKTKRDA